MSKPEIKNGFEVPKWAGKPPPGLHLDVMKDEKMIQKLMIDEKNCYFFGRNKDCCDFVTDHASCSRVHAVLVWHKHLNRSFLIDLNSAHGTFIGTLRLEPNKPQQMFVDTEFKFGASTRTYVLRERPQMNKNFPSILSNTGSSLNESLTDQENPNNESLNASTLPESEAELENLTEFNTAHNKRIAQLVVADLNSSGTAGMPVQVKRKKKSVVFMEDVEIINPEDIDPTIGRFRNMISTTIVIPNKKKRPNIPGVYESQSDKRIRISDKLHDNSSEYSHDEQSFTLYDEDDNYEFPNEYGYSNLGIKKLDLAPDVDQNKSDEAGGDYSSMLNKQVHDSLSQQSQQHQDAVSQFDKRKKYVKEAWPGRESALVATTSSSNTRLNTSDTEPTKQVVSSSVAPFIPEKPPASSQTSSGQPSKRLMI